jgi:hypothetical protein
MDVVLHSADTKSFHLMLARDAAHVCPKPRLYLRSDGLAALFGGEDTMKQRATIGV